VHLVELIAIVAAGLLIGTELTAGLAASPSTPSDGDPSASSLATMAWVYLIVIVIWYAATAALFGLVSFKLFQGGLRGYRLALAGSVVAVAAGIFALFQFVGRRKVHPRSSDDWLGVTSRSVMLHFFRVTLLGFALLLFVYACFMSSS
jgi:hypothetical protein